MRNLYNFNGGRIPNHEKLLLWFPDMLYSYTKLIESLMTSKSILPIDWRYYIAITAVSLYGCVQLYDILV